MNSYGQDECLQLPDGRALNTASSKCRPNELTLGQSFQQSSIGLELVNEPERPAATLRRGGPEG